LRRAVQAQLPRPEPRRQARAGAIPRLPLAVIRQQSAEDIRRIQNETYQNRQHSQDVQNQRFSQHIRDVETFRDPNSGTSVELSNQYGHAWSNGAGEYILSDSPSFNPNAHVNGNWTQMQQVQPE
jgi:hypothetical protein